MFEFKNVTHSKNDSELFGSCLISEHMPFFAGHFEGQPIMPAAAQVLMIDLLVRSSETWSMRVKGGQHIKFNQTISPGDRIDINLARINEHLLRFTLRKEDKTLVSKGELNLTAGYDFE